MKALFIGLLLMITSITHAQLRPVCPSADIFVLTYSAEATYKSTLYSRVLDEEVETSAYLAIDENDKPNVSEKYTLEEMEYLIIQSTSLAGTHVFNIYMGEFFDFYVGKDGTNYYVWYSGSSQSFTIIGVDERVLPMITSIRTKTAYGGGIECHCHFLSKTR